MKVARRFIALAKSHNAFVPFGTTEKFGSFHLMFGRPYGTWFLPSPPPLAMNRQATFGGLYETNVTQTGHTRILHQPSKSRNPFRKKYPALTLELGGSS